MDNAFADILLNIFTISFLLGLVVAVIYAYFYVQGRRRRRNLERAEATVCLQISFPAPDQQARYFDPKANANQTKRFLQKWHAQLLKKGLKAYLEGQDFFGLEIAATSQAAQAPRLGFYIQLPRPQLPSLAALLQQEFPNASWDELPNLPLGERHDRAVAALELSLSQNELLPLKTYLESEQVLSAELQRLSAKLQKDEGWSVQIVLQALNSDHWQHLSVEQARKLQQTDLKQAERARALEKKAKEPGFKTSLRILAQAPDKFRAEALLQELALVFQILNDETGNSLQGQYRENESREICNSYLGHTLPSKLQIWNVLEIASVFQLPAQSSSTEQIQWQNYRNLPVSPDAATQGLLLGQNIFEKHSDPVYLAESDRSAGILLLGKDATGKSNLLYNLIQQDLAKGMGLALLDSTGALSDRLLANFPKDRAADLVLIDFKTAERPYGLNFLAVKDAAQKTSVLKFFAEFCQTLFPVSVFTPTLQNYFEKALLTLWQDPDLNCNLASLLNFFLDQANFNYELDACQDQELKDFWSKLGEQDRLMLQEFCSKQFLPLLSKPVLQMALTPSQTYWNSSEWTSAQVVIFNLSHPQIDELQLKLLSQIVLYKLQQTRQLNPYLDDCQFYPGASILKLLQSAQADNLKTTLSYNALQNTTPALKKYLLDEIGTLLLFRSSEQDARELATDKLSVTDLQNIAPYKAYARLQLAGTKLDPCTFNIAYQAEVGSQTLARALSILSNLKYARDRKFNTN